MGFSYFSEWENVDTQACSKCQYYAPGKNGYKHFCKSKGNGSNEIQESDETAMECSEWDVNDSVDAEVGESSQNKGIAGKLADKAKGELKKAALRDLNTIGRNLGKMI